MKIWITALGISIAALNCGCQKKEAGTKNLQVLNLNIPSEPPTLDPRKATDTTSLAVIKMCFEGLSLSGTDNTVLPGMACRYEVSEDKKTYTFFLRDAKWSDGTPVTAYDFESTWRTILDPAFPSEYASDLYVIKNGQAAKEKGVPVSEIGVKALDDKTLVVELELPYTYFLALTATHSFLAVPQHIALSHPEWANHAGKYYVSNGPFVLKGWRHNNDLTVEKNPDYWDSGKVKLERLYLAIIEDETTELSMYENNELDWAGSPLSTLPIDALKFLSEKGLLTTYPISGTYYYVFNTLEHPFNNANLRKAFALAINRQEIIENITQAQQIPATALIPPTMWKDDRHYFKDADLAEARRLFAVAMQEMGIEPSELGPITLSYNTLNAHHKIAQAIQEQWFVAFGVRVNLENMEWKVFLDKLAHKQFQIARMGGIASFNDPISFLDLYKYPKLSNNHPGWYNPEYSKLLEEADMTIDVDKRMLLLRRAEKLMIEEMPIAPIYFYTGSYMIKPYVKGIRISEMNDVDFKDAYVEKR